MYYPILRGRQNELLAVRELAQSGKLAHVTPVIEPIKASSTLLTTIDAVTSAKVSLMLIANPKVGAFANDLKNDPEFADSYRDMLARCEDITLAYWTDGDARVKTDETHANRTAYFYERGFESGYDDACNVRKPDFTFVNAGFPRMKRHAHGKPITLDGQYTPQLRNADYREHGDDFLSEEHLYYEEDGFCGFSDYSIIGAEYNEGGFMPQVVAIHLTYFDSKEVVRVRHFASSNGFGERDIARKFSDALVKMVAWANESHVPKTEGLQEYIDIMNGERFPGLGYAKKLSLKHHMEMMNAYLEGRR